MRDLVTAPIGDFSLKSVTDAKSKRSIRFYVREKDSLSLNLELPSYGEKIQTMHFWCISQCTSYIHEGLNILVQILVKE